jgi:hypothetical protein
VGRKGWSVVTVNKMGWVKPHLRYQHMQPEVPELDLDDGMYQSCKASSMKQVLSAHAGNSCCVIAEALGLLVWCHPMPCWDLPLCPAAWCNQTCPAAAACTSCWPVAPTSEACWDIICHAGVGGDVQVHRHCYCQAPISHLLPDAPLQHGRPGPLLPLLKQYMR